MARRKYRRSRRRRRSYEYHPRKAHRVHRRKSFKFHDGKRIAKGAYAGGKVVYIGGKKFVKAAPVAGRAVYVGAKRVGSGIKTVAKYGIKGAWHLRKFPTPPSD